MNSEMIIEIVGYIGSFLVLVSFLMTSVFKLRVVNTIGSLIFMIYALIIKSYPTAVMNFCLVLINLHFLWKMSHSHKEYELVEVEDDDKFLQYTLEHYQDDIKFHFPELKLELDKFNKNYIITSNAKPVGITVCDVNGDEVKLLLDYTIPEFRDFSIGSFLLEKLKERGIRKVISLAPNANHIKYLESNGFTKNGEYYEKYL